MALTNEQKKEKVRDLRPIDDGTDIADLMSCFTKKEVKNPKFPMLSSEVTRLKETEGGLQSMCEVMQKYEKIAAEEAKHQERLQIIKTMIQQNYSKENILRLNFSEAEYNEAEKAFLSNGQN